MKRAVVTMIALSAMLSLVGCGANTPTIQTQTAALAQLEANRVYPVVQVMGIGPAYAAKLKEAGLPSTKKFLESTRTRKEREALADKTGISNKLILAWAHKVELMQISGIGPEMSQLLDAVGVASTKELARRNATNLQERMAIANAIDPKRKFVDRLPSVNTVSKWIEKAKTIHTVQP
ncbi:MAG TPA: DUF4332 domain-containing protein [Cyanobacteria bacterium UBA8530]|nr:DUF4332 domain-containing protein [Cyanobacteria bacterium UBA8530]